MLWIKRFNIKLFTIEQLKNHILNSRVSRSGEKGSTNYLLLNTYLTVKLPACHALEQKVQLIDIS